MSENKPSTYIYWVCVTAKGCFLGWRNLPAHLSYAWRSFKEFSYDFQFVLWSMALPLLTPFAPIIALLLRREYRRQEAREVAANKEWQDEFLKNAQRDDTWLDRKDKDK